MSDRQNRGFTLVELLIVIVVIAILAAVSIVAYNGIQKRSSNSATVAAVKQYITAIELYQVQYGDYPQPPSGASNQEYSACFGDEYEDGICLVEDDEPMDVHVQPWFTDAMKKVAPRLPPLPQYVKWNDGGNALSAGAFYVATEYYHHSYLDDGDFASADGLVVYYLLGNVPDMCNMHNGHADVYLKGHSTDKDITICYIPIGNYVAY